MVRRSRSSSSSASSSSGSSTSSSGSSSSSSSSSSRSPRRRSRSPVRKGGRRSATPDRRRRRTSSPAPTKAKEVKESTPEPQTRITVKNLSRNITKDHVAEVFGIYGAIKDIKFPVNAYHSFCRGDSDITYEKHDDAEKALKHMDGGQIDGKIISVDWTPATPPPRSARQRSRSPVARRRSPPPARAGRRSRSPVRRSRSPIRRSRSPRRGSPPRGFRARSPRRSPPFRGRSPRRSPPARRGRSPPARRGAVSGGNTVPLGRRRSPS